jgi:HK97 family phage prohead protease
MEHAMPLKPGKDESQSDFMERCMSEVWGTDAQKEGRTQEQAVAICMSYWRDAKGGEKPDKSAPKTVRKQDVPVPEDDEEREDFLDRCTESLLEDDADEDEAYAACEQAWDERAAKATVREPIFHKTHTGGVVEGKEFILSDESQDRMGDIIMSDGWDIKSFKNNPIALFNHNPNFPIGKWDNLRVEKGALRGKLHLAPKGTSARIDEIRKLIEAGILQAVSVGFRPSEYEPLDKKNPFAGARYTKQELVETSLVSVPANPNALAVTKMRGEDGGSSLSPSTAKHLEVRRETAS